MAKDQAFIPPYISFSTLTGLFERMENEPPPPRIDRTYLDNMSGGYQTAVITALKSFDLIGETGEVTPTLIELVKNPDERQKMIAAILRDKYSEQIELGEKNATQGQLEEVFKRYGFTGETLRKAIAFFLHACNYAQIPLSPHFRAPKRVKGAPRKRAKKPTPRTVVEEQPTGQVETGTGDTLTITLAGGEEVSLAVSTGILSLPRTDRDFVLRLVDLMQDYDADAGLDKDDETEDEA